MTNSRCGRADPPVPGAAEPPPVPWLPRSLCPLRERGARSGQRLGWGPVWSPPCWPKPCRWFQHLLPPPNVRAGLSAVLASRPQLPWAPLRRGFREGLHQLLKKGTGRRWKGRGKQLAPAQRGNRARGERTLFHRVPATLPSSPCGRGCTKGVQLPIQNRTVNKLHLGPVAGLFTKRCCYKQGCARFQVTMADRAAAERACKDPNPIIDGRKANVNLAYLGAKPRSIQTGEASRRSHLSVLE